MTIEIIPGDPRHPDATALLKASHALMEELFPPEDNFFLDIDDLCVPEISFFVAHEGDRILGTAAIADKGDYGEVKSMFVSPDARGKGVGEALLAQIEATARAVGHDALKLETGNVLHAAHRLYQRAGFTLCGPFGDYPEAASSIFMEKAL
ncbi:GNAT family N-acetyltransferase [Aliiroseovarius sp. KMU-50]|uniref:GNAT family N-acetyltransferase n=1 Tax=Aliiroseovarius salicola TaxID=3009082 RepID=A0ABT4W4I8_9RHOB|nr:GNAT family N-acetyltransferase [Aliiroseovarius sp. KMU-50]MDA5095429.1 GNAT family N-acetyltransferase [Aliiroseovarius sp. KMU-50]